MLQYFPPRCLSPGQPLSLCLWQKRRSPILSENSPRSPCCVWFPAHTSASLHVHQDWHTFFSFPLELHTQDIRNDLQIRPVSENPANAARRIPAPHCIYPQFLPCFLQPPAHRKKDSPSPPEISNKTRRNRTIRPRLSFCPFADTSALPEPEHPP